MKTYNNIFKSIALGAAVLTLASCNDYLDTLPDDRATVDSPEKIKSLLVSAYPSNSSNFLLEYSSDNVTDNGKQYTCQPNQDKCYRWEQVETTGNDDPKSIWGEYYLAVATANAALDGVAVVGENSTTLPMKAEALLCRAYAMLQLANTFCMAYDPTKADEYMGVPYPKASGQSVDERGTIGETYANINADIEEALPLLDDSYLETPKYHFNTRAAYAFAARFNLYYHNYDKAIEYATKALGADPASLLRQTSTFASLGGAQAISDEYIRTSQAANFMLRTSYSLAGRSFWSSSFNRFAYNRAMITNELFWAKTPWGSGSSSNCLYEASLLYGNNQTIYYPKMIEVFEYTDKVNGTGYAHTVDAVFTADETLIVRAEAYALKKDYDKACADLNTWASVRLKASAGSAKRPTFTPDYVNQYMETVKCSPVVIVDDAERTIVKPMTPQGFTLEEGTQKNLIALILHVRRLETIQQGLRFQDVKRYGMEFSHNLDGEDALVFKPGDLRGALQLPIDVIDAGLPANPRETETDTKE